MQPRELTTLYYKLLYSGDLNGIRNIMTHTSYIMTLNSLGLHLSWDDKNFKILLKQIETDEDALSEVEKLLSQDLKKRDEVNTIKILKTEMNGLDRQTVHYTQNGKVKKLYYSKEPNGWKINYYAGRKVD